jgi:4-amino-4-deoxy-L-arabinose transferase-like glycosyltransferase
MVASPAAPHAAERSRGARPRSRLRAWVASVPAPLKLILLLAVLQSVAWDLATPVFQGPDEAEHYAYVNYFAETGHLPHERAPVSNARPGRKTGSTEQQEAMRWLNLEPLLANRNERPAWSAADLGLWHSVERSLPPGSKADEGAAGAIAKNPPLYYAVMALPYRAFAGLSLIKRVFVLRLFNALFYLATIALVWLIAGELFGGVRWKQALAAGVVALEPQLSFMSAAINADNLLIALTTGFLLAALRLVRRGPSVPRVLLASLLAGAAVLTHGRGLVTVPVLAVALVVAWVQHRPARREALVLGVSAAVPVGLAFLAYVLVTKGASNGTLYGGQVGEFTPNPGFRLGQFLSTTWDFYFERFIPVANRLGPKWGYHQVFIEQFFGSFGSQEVTFPKRLYDSVQALSVVALLGLCAAVVARRRQLLRAWPSVAVMLALLLTTLVALHYVDYRALLDNGGSSVLFVGRYLLPMVALFGLAIVFTVDSLRGRVAAALGGGILGCGVLLSLAGIGLSIFRFYA